MRVLVLTFDCLPRRWLGCYGGHDLPTPGFDALATYGTTYDLAFASAIPAEYEPALSKIGREMAVQIVEATSGSDGPQLVQSLGEAIAFLEETSSAAALACVRHAGFRVQDRPRMAVDEVESIAEQLVELDCSIGVFFEQWRETAEDDWRLIVMGAEGLLQPQDAEHPADPDLCDDWVHVPLWVIAGTGERFGTRDSRLLSTDAIGPTLKQWFSAAEDDPEERLLVEDADGVRIEGPGQRGIRTREWFFRLSDGQDHGELFQKPEDVWDVNDLADRRPEVAESLAARFAAGR